MVTCVHMSILTHSTPATKMDRECVFKAEFGCGHYTHTACGGGRSVHVVAAVSSVRVRRVGGRRAAGDALCCAAAVARMLQLR